MGVPYFRDHDLNPHILHPSYKAHKKGSLIFENLSVRFPESLRVDRLEWTEGKQLALVGRESGLNRNHVLVTLRVDCDRTNGHARNHFSLEFEQNNMETCPKSSNKSFPKLMDSLLQEARLVDLYIFTFIISTLVVLSPLPPRHE